MKAFAEQLKYERELHSWSQEQLAEMIGTTAPNVSRWERNITFPGLHFRQKLGEVLGKNVEELFLFEAVTENHVRAQEQETQLEEPGPLLSPPGVSSILWNLPHQRNLCFTGREEIFARLHDALNSHSPGNLEAQILAISGLGGIGKTQLALEYAYRYSDEYQAVFWVRAETPDELMVDFAAIAGVLKLTENQPQSQREATQAVKQWFSEHADWLLVLDNLESLAPLNDFIPFKSKGHVILTTRLQSTGSFVRRLDLGKMTLDEGAILLLRRAKQIEPEETLEHLCASDRIVARQISQFLDGLPLALDQAGAYIEDAACDLAHYFDLLQRAESKLLGLRSLADGGNVDHPHSVHATLSLTFDRIKQANPAAIDLLQLFAFLYPEAIPEEMVIEGLSYLSAPLQSIASDPLKYDATIAELRRHSLLYRNSSTKTFTIHRLVQAVLRDDMDQALQCKWATWAVQMINHVFPEVEHWITSNQCQRYFSQAQVAVSLINEWDIRCIEASHLLTQFACYLYERKDYELIPPAHIERMLQKAIVILQHCAVSAAASHEMANAQQILGWLYIDCQKYVQAKQYIQNALETYEHLPEPDQRSIADCFANLAEIHERLGQFAQAEPLYEQVLKLSEKLRGPEHMDVLIDLRNLGVCYVQQRKYAQAAPLLQRALTIGQNLLGHEHVIPAGILSALGRLYLEQGNYTQAEPLLQQALEIHHQKIRPGHHAIVTTLNLLGRLYLEQGQYAQAEPLLQQALEIQQKRLWAGDATLTARIFNNLARLAYARGNLVEARSLFQQSHRVLLESLGPDHPMTLEFLETAKELVREN